MRFEDFNLIALAFGIAVTYFTSYLLGRLILKKTIKKELSSLPFSVALPIYLAFGLAILVIVYFAFAIFALSVVAPILMLLISLLVTLLSSVRSRVEFGKLRNLVAGANLVPLVLFGLNLLFFISSADYLQWPLPGDVMHFHGPMVGLIEYHGRLPVTLDPLVQYQTVQYPPGFAVLVATSNTFLRLYPAQAALVIATCIVALIPSIIYSLTFIFTRSIVFSSLGFLSVFAIHPASLAKWLVGFFYNGPYPNLTGFMLIFAFATLVAAMEKKQQNKHVLTKQSLLLTIILVTALILVYPTFALLIALFAPTCLLAFTCSHRHHISKHISVGLQSLQKTNRKMLILKLVFAVSLICLVSLMLLTYAQFYLPKGALYPEDQQTFESRFRNYAISPDFFVDHPNGILLIIAGFIAGYLVVRKNGFGLPILYLVVLIPAVVSLGSQLFPYVAYILPSRSIIVCSVLSWPLVLAGIHSVTGKLGNTLKRSNVSLSGRVTRKRIVSVTRGLAVCTLLALLLPSLLSYATFETTQKRGWFTHNSWFPESMAALEWIHNNVSPTDLILNDGSFTSRFATSLSPKNLVYSRLAMKSYLSRSRAESLLEIWSEPTNIVKVASLLKKWNVSYVLSTSELGVSSDPQISSIFYEAKPFQPETYANLFDTYPFLTVVFSQGWTRVYKVGDLDITRSRAISVLTTGGWAEGKLLTLGAWGENGTIGVPIVANETTQNISRPPWLLDDAYLLGLEIPEGDRRFWGIHYTIQEFRNWTSADFLTFWVLSSSRRGLSVTIKDVMGNGIRYDFTTEEGGWEQIYVPLDAPTEKGPIDFTEVDTISITTGWKPPHPEAGDTLLLYQLSIVYIITS